MSEDKCPVCKNNVPMSHAAYVERGQTRTVSAHITCGPFKCLFCKHRVFLSLDEVDPASLEVVKARMSDKSERDLVAHKGCVKSILEGQGNKIGFSINQADFGGLWPVLLQCSTVKDGDIQMQIVHEAESETISTPSVAPEPELKLKLSEQEILRYLDDCINKWRTDERDFQEYYVDVFQSVRASLFGSCLPKPKWLGYLCYACNAEVKKPVKIIDGMIERYAHRYCAGRMAGTGEYVLHRVQS